jgi:putative transcription factor
MNCDLCGAKVEKPFEAEIEGAVLRVCSECVKMGKVISKPSFNQVGNNNHLRTNAKQEFDKDAKFDRMFEKRYEIVLGYGKIVKDAREKLNIKQAQLAKMISEKESLIHAIESEKHEPNEKLCKKIEKILSIKLLQKVVDIDEEDVKVQNNSKNVTIGDMIKIKKK